MPSSEVMTKFKNRTLRSGGPGGKVVTNPMQAVAIKYSEAKNEAETGSADTPKRGKRPTRKKH